MFNTIHHSGESRRRAMLKSAARNALPGFYPKLVLSSLIVSVIDLFLTESVPIGSTSFSGDLIYYISTAIIFLIVCLLKAGLNRQALLITREKPAGIADILYSLRNHPDHLLLAFFRMIPFAIIGAVIPVLLLIFRGRFVSYENFWPYIIYTFGVFILGYALVWVCLIPCAMSTWLYVESPEQTPGYFISESLRLMKGEYVRYLLLNLSFAGYYLLGLLSFGIALPWVSTYRRTVLAHYYLELKQAKSQ